LALVGSRLIAGESCVALMQRGSLRFLWVKIPPA